MSTAEITNVVVTSLSAIATGAALWLVIIERRRDRESRRPNVSAMLYYASFKGTLLFVNAGPGLAIRTTFFGVIGGKRISGQVGRGFLQPGEEQKHHLHVTLGPPTAPEPLVWVAHDTAGDGHLWSNDARYVKLSRKELVDGKPKASELFKRMYPDVDVPDGSA